MNCYDLNRIDITKKGDSAVALGLSELQSRDLALQMILSTFKQLNNINNIIIEYMSCNIFLLLDASITDSHYYGAGIQTGATSNPSDFEEKTCNTFRSTK